MKYREKHEVFGGRKDLGMQGREGLCKEGHTLSAIGREFEEEREQAAVLLVAIITRPVAHHIIALHAHHLPICSPSIRLVVVILELAHHVHEVLDNWQQGLN